MLWLFSILSITPKKLFTRASEYLKIVMFSGSKEIYMLNLQHILKLLGKLSVKNVQGWQKKSLFKICRLKLYARTAVSIGKPHF